MSITYQSLLRSVTEIIHSAFMRPYILSAGSELQTIHHRKRVSGEHYWGPTKNHVLLYTGTILFAIWVKRFARNVVAKLAIWFYCSENHIHNQLQYPNRKLIEPLLWKWEIADSRHGPVIYEGLSNGICFSLLGAQHRGDTEDPLDEI